MRKKLKARSGSHPDYLILLCLAVLIVFGLVMLSSASSNLSKVKYGDTYYYLKHQVLYGLLPGFGGFLVMSLIYYRRYEKYALWPLILSIILLGLVFTSFGVQTKGAARWLTFGPVTFQPSELLKITFVIYLASWLNRRTERQKNFLSGFVPFFIVSAVIAGLLLRQPSTSTTAILLLTALAVYFMSGAKISYILGTGAVALAVFASVIYFTPYRLERIKSYFEPGTDIRQSGFHLNQALIAIGSGGWTGVGYGQSTTKISYLPEPVGDSIFAVIAEELGFVGASVLIIVFLFLVMRFFLLARKCRDKFGQLLLVGFGTVIAIQTFVHIAAISGLIPLTGTPLPFISYGGTALAVFMTMGGIVVNISKYS